jgi:hypothetical protein
MGNFVASYYKQMKCYATDYTGRNMDFSLRHRAQTGSAAFSGSCFMEAEGPY